MAVNRERKMVPKMQETLDLDFTSLGFLLKVVERSITLYGADAVVEKYSPPYETSEYYGIFSKVPETDQQMEHRIAQEEKWEAEAAIREKAEFERLSKKYGGTT